MGTFGKRGDDRVDDVLDLVFATLGVLLYQLLLRSCLAVVLWFGVYDGFVLLFWIADSECAFKVISVRSTCGLKAQYSLTL